MKSQRSTLILFSFFLSFLFAFFYSNSLLGNEGKNKAVEIMSPAGPTVKSDSFAGMRGVYRYGIKDPKGNKQIFATSKMGADAIEGVLAKYPSENIEGVKFYKVTSWADTSKAVQVSYADRDMMIWALYDEISKLKKRVLFLEKKLSEK